MEETKAQASPPLPLSPVSASGTSSPHPQQGGPSIPSSKPPFCGEVKNLVVKWMDFWAPGFTEQALIQKHFQT